MYAGILKTRMRKETMYPIEEVDYRNLLVTPFSILFERILTKMTSYDKYNYVCFTYQTWKTIPEDRG